MKREDYWGRWSGVWCVVTLAVFLGSNLANLIASWCWGEHLIDPVKFGLFGVQVGSLMLQILGTLAWLYADDEEPGPKLDDSQHDDEAY